MPNIKSNVLNNGKYLFSELSSFYFVHSLQRDEVAKRLVSINLQIGKGNSVTLFVGESKERTRLRRFER